MIYIYNYHSPHMYIHHHRFVWFRLITCPNPEDGLVCGFAHASPIFFFFFFFFCDLLCIFNLDMIANMLLGSIRLLNGSIEDVMNSALYQCTSSFQFKGTNKEGWICTFSTQ
jgi:hypothetical protein